MEAALESYRTARRAVKFAIKASKARCWTELLETVARDPWGLPYRIVMNKLRKPEQVPYLNELRNMETVVRNLFPLHNLAEPRSRPHIDPGDIPLFTHADLTAACSSLGVGKAPGPDCIPNEVIIIVAKEYPDLLLRIYNDCITRGVFHDEWKRQRLVLLPKGGKPPDDPSAYRPLCMLNGLGKLLEKLILHRLHGCIEPDGLSERQFGFRKGRSTIDAIETVVRGVRETLYRGSGSAKASGHAIFITLDVKNAFNSARWDRIMTALEESGRIPLYLLRLLDSYFSNRILEYSTADGRAAGTYSVTAGVPQGSVLGPTLWNIMYDGVLRLELPRGAVAVGFADDLGLLITARRPEELEHIGNESTRRIGRWFEENGLELAAHKTEAVLLTRKRNVAEPDIFVGSTRVTYQRTIRYLGVYIDDKLNFRSHAEIVANKARRTVAALGKLMPNLGGPKQKRRKLLCSVVNSILLYGAPVWARSMGINRTRQKLASPQRSIAIRAIAAYSTVSGAACLITAGIPPIDLLALERETTYRGKPGPGTREPAAVCEARKKAARLELLAAWQRRWDEGETGRWTHRLIPAVSPWTEREHGETQHHLVQLLTGHGCFGSYLFRIGKEASPGCHHCEADLDDAEHTLFRCPAWEEPRRTLEGSLGQPISVGNLVNLMLEGESNWRAVCHFASTVMDRKLRAERLREPHRPRRNRPRWGRPRRGRPRRGRPR
jgi:hypothetical protein